jgi:hypothetical protein
MTSRQQGEAVLLLDLRDSPGEAGELRLFDILHNQRWLNSRRFLVVDEATALVDHYSIYQAMQASRMQRKVLCVAVGAPVSRSRGEAVKTPQVLNNDTSMTLWVGDLDGVSWPGELSFLAQHDGWRGPVRQSLRTLLDVLMLPEVFDSVIEMSGELPGRIASPGQLVMAGQVGLDDLHRAQLAAVETVVGRPDANTGGRAGLDDYRAVIGLAEPVQEDRLREGAALDRVHRRCVEQCKRARESVDGLVGPLGPTVTDRSGRVWAQVQDAGAGLDSFRESVGRLFRRIDGRTGLDQARRDDIEQSGLDIHELPDTDQASITERLREQCTAGLDRGRSLTALAGWLRDIADQATPVGSAARLDRLTAACPDRLVDRLCNPPRFPWRADSWVVLLAVILLSMLAGLGPFGLATGPALVIAWVAAVGHAAARQPAPDRSGLRNAARLALPLHLFAAAGGCVAGALMSRALGADVPALAGLLAAGAAAIGLAAVMRFWWVQAVRQWQAALAVRQAMLAANALRRELCEVAVDEWILSDARRFTADAALAVSSAIRDVAASLRESTQPGPAGDATSRITAVGLDLQRVIDADVVDLVRYALNPCWKRLAVGAVDDIRAGLRDRLDDLLTGYRMHLEARGVDETPFFGTRSADRDALAKTLWEEAPVVDHLLNDLPPTGPMTQLCTADDLSLLNLATDRMRLVRFAPRAARSAVASHRAGGSAAANVIWTSSGHVAGALRLVPLRDDAFTLAWPADVENQDRWL